MRAATFKLERPSKRSTRNMLIFAAAGCALLAATEMFSGSQASASGGSGATLQASLHGDLSNYLTARRKTEHISAVSLRVTYPGTKPSINLAVGRTRYTGGSPVSTRALWQIGSNTKAFTSVILLQLEAEGKPSINDPVGKFLPQYPAWRDITIERLLNMTSRIPNYTSQPAFVTAIAKNPARRFTAAQLVAYAVGAPLTPKGYAYSNTDYILAQMIIQWVTHDSYAGQLTKRIITPLHLHTLCYAPITCPASDAALMPAGYFFESVAPSLLGRAMPPLAESWAQGAGAIVSSLADMTTWDRALYQGQELPPAQQRQLESLVSLATGEPIRTTTLDDPVGYGLGISQLTNPSAGTIWWHKGSPLGARVLHFYFPRSGLIIALAVNSATGPTTSADPLIKLAVTVHKTLQEAGALNAG